MIFLIFIATSVLCVCGEETDNYNLELVHVFFRHGSRTPDPQETYPNDPYKIDDFFPREYGQLTNSGKQRAYQLGKILRHRYGKLLGDIYTTDAVYTKSTDYTRTKMSALLVLAGLFPPSTAQIWDEDLMWMPIPYDYERSENDRELRRPTYFCPAYTKELNKVYKSDSFQKFFNEHSSTFQYLQEHSGLKIKRLKDAFFLYQVLFAEENMNLTLPAWTKNVYPDTLYYLASQQCFIENSSSMLKRLSGGRTLKRVIENMISKSDGVLKPLNRKMYLYSGHEYSVVNVLAALDLFEPHFPNYSSAVAIEMYGINNTDQHFVKVVYFRDVDKEPEEQHFPGCSNFCSLEEFINIVEPYLPFNYTKECASSILLD